MHLRDFVPPVVVSAARSLRPPPGNATFASFEDAERACGPQSYDDRGLLESLRVKTERHRAECAARPPVLWPGEALLLAAIGLLSADRPVRVLDHGGSLGRHYFSLRTALPSTTRLRWAVAERASHVPHAASLVSDELSVHGSVEDASAAIGGQPDVVFTSGALQCCADPVAALRELAALGGRYLVLARVGLERGERAVYVVNASRISQHGWSGLPDGMADREIRHPLAYPPERAFESELAQRYRVRARLRDESGVEMSLRGTVDGWCVLAEAR